MRAMVQDSYGSPDLLRVSEVNGPRVGKSQVLVRVCAASLNARDWRRVRGNPFMVRVVEGLRRPRWPLFGTDLAGVVEELGSGATSLEVGDEVFGTAKGSLAEYVSAKDVARKPAGVSFEEAASVPVAGLTALQALRDKGKVRSRTHVLVNGAGGGVGSFAVQIAKALGAHVIATTRSESADLVAKLGAHEVITHDQKKLGSGYDVIIDVGGTPSLRALQDALGPGGKLILVGAGRGSGGPLGRVLGGAIRPRVTPFLSKASVSDLEFLKDVVTSGDLKPVIDRTYRLEEIAEALGYLESGHPRGKVVVTI
jgi:NADPH:quinone reductase-like Zn-dependent oxidoreductase